MKRLTDKLPYFLCYLIAFVLAMKQLREPDIWWQLLSGRWMLEHGQVTKTDVFSYTMYGHPWVNVKWLYEIIIASIEKGFGPEGVLLLQGLVNISIVYFLLRIVKQFSQQLQRPVSPSLTAIAILLFLAIVEYRMAGRPEMISHLLCCVFLFLLISSQQFKWKHFFWLIPLQCLWANMHEGYPVGLVLLGTFIAGNVLHYFIRNDKQSLQQASNSLFLCVVAALAVSINPNGVQLWKQTFEIYRQVGSNKYTTELYSFTQSEYWTIEAKWHVVLLIAVLLYWLLQLRKEWGNKNSFLFSPAMLTYLLLIPLFGYLSLTANRNIVFSEIILLPSLPFLLSSLIKAIKADTLPILRKNVVWLVTAVAIVFYISIVNNSFYKFTGFPNKYGLHVNMLHNPTGAADFLKNNHISGTGFSDYFVSSYLLWNMYPDFKSYIDLRDLDVFPEDFFNDYFSMYRNPAKFYEADKKYNFNYVVVSTSQLIGLQKKLYNEKGYFLLYVDPVAAVFIKETPANKLLIENTNIVKLFSWPLPPEDPSWSTALTKLFNPFVNYDEEEEIHANAHAIAYYNTIGDYATSIQLGRKGKNDPETLRALADTYEKVSMYVSDPTLKQAYHDSAVYFLSQSNALVH